MKDWQPTPLPVEEEFETEKILRKLITTRSTLAELKGAVTAIPNEEILLNTLPLQEAKDSSAIENIVTTHDDLFKATLDLRSTPSLAAKEVQNYAQSLKHGYGLVKKFGFISSNHIQEIQAILESNNAGFRKLPGTSLKNAATGEVIYTPPQDADTIRNLMTNLETYINDSDLNRMDPLVKMAIIHFQFESIHPFYDGNGRTGRIINILYLVLQQLLNLPILYMSGYIIRNKDEYYRRLQGVRLKNDWESWILYMLAAVEATAHDSMKMVNDIRLLLMEYKHILRSDFKFYSQDLLNNLFRHPYTRIEFIQKDLGVSRITAASYLDQLSKEGGILRKEKAGPNNYYVNTGLMKLFLER